MTAACIVLNGTSCSGKSSIAAATCGWFPINPPGCGRDALAAANPLWVGVHCPLFVAEQRERERGDRIVGTARGQHARVHTFREYDLDVDTSVTAPRQCAEAILTALDARGVRTGRSRQ